MLPSELHQLRLLSSAYVLNPSLRNFRALRDYALLDSFSVDNPVVQTSELFISALGRHYSLFSRKFAPRGEKRQIATHFDKRLHKYLNALRSSSHGDEATHYVKADESLSGWGY